MWDVHFAVFSSKTLRYMLFYKDPLAGSQETSTLEAGADYWAVSHAFCIALAEANGSGGQLACFILCVG